MDLQLQRAKLLERCNTLQCKFEAWREIRHLYMPAVTTICARADADTSKDRSSAFDVKILLPSEVVDDIRCPQ